MYLNLPLQLYRTGTGIRLQGKNMTDIWPVPIDQKAMDAGYGKPPGAAFNSCPAFHINI